MNIALFGDLGIDRYIVTQPRGLSAEAPILILDQIRELELPGMAGNVAANLNAFGLEGKLHFSGGNQPAKNRVVTEDGHQICRFDVADYTEPYVVGDFRDLDWGDVDLIVVSDYLKGSITQLMIGWLNGLGKPMFVDTKGDPFLWSHGEDVLLFPNQSEYSKFGGSYDQFPNVILKQGEWGAAYMQYGRVIFTRPSLAEPAKVRCVNGAGDTVLAAYVAAEVLKLDAVKAMEFAMAAAANVCEQPFDQRTTSLEETSLRLSESKDPVWFDRELAQREMARCRG